MRKTIKKCSQAYYLPNARVVINSTKIMTISILFILTFLSRTSEINTSMKTRKITFAYSSIQNRMHLF